MARAAWGSADFDGMSATDLEDECAIAAQELVDIGNWTWGTVGGYECETDSVAPAVGSKAALRRLDRRVAYLESYVTACGVEEDRREKAR